MDPALLKAQRDAMDRLRRDLQYLGGKDWLAMAIGEEIPPEWHTLEHDTDVAEKKVKVTLYLDTSVARFYRQQGVGYQGRINRLLATYMNMKIAGELEIERILEERIGVKEYLERQEEKKRVKEEQEEN